MSSHTSSFPVTAPAIEISRVHSLFRRDLCSERDAEGEQATGAGHEGDSAGHPGGTEQSSYSDGHQRPQPGETRQRE